MRLLPTLLVSALIAQCCAFAEVRVRPTQWAQPVIGSASLSNLYQVSDSLYRSEQPDSADLTDLKSLGVKTIVSLRRHHTDSKKFAQAGILNIQYKMDAGSITYSNLVQVLRAIRSSPKPVLVHCWHGSDRTGFVVAGYRIIEQKWTVDQAIEELKFGGYGYHASIYGNIEKLLRDMNVDSIRKEVDGVQKPNTEARPARQ